MYRTFTDNYPNTSLIYSGFKEKSKKGLLTRVLYALGVILLIALGLTLVVSGRTLPIPYKLFTVESGSMRPTIKQGDLIFVSQQESYAVGDVIAFNASTIDSQRVITHRIVEVQEGGNLFTTKGDANNANDLDKVYAEDVIGKLSLTIPLLGYPIQFVKTPIGVALLIITPAILIIADQLSNIRNELQKRKFKENAIY